MLGADSTSTFQSPDEKDRHFDHAQKIFEVGEDSALGIVTWGVGNLGERSYRTLIAEFADTAPQRKKSLQEAATVFSEHLWVAYSQTFHDEIAEANELSKIAEPTDEQKERFAVLGHEYSTGFRIGGRVEESRKPEAYEIGFSPDISAAPEPAEIILGPPAFWGVPHIIKRVTIGVDPRLLASIATSDCWKGTHKPMNVAIG